MAIKNIIFDVGQVLFYYNPHKIIDRLLPNTSFKDTYLQDLFLSPIWNALDRGDVSHEEAIEKIIALNPNKTITREDLSTLLKQFVYELDLVKENKVLFLHLKQQHPVYILSNFQEEPFNDLLAENPFMNEANGMVISAKINMIKPEKEIYHHLLSTYQLKAEECVFIDDLHDNIAACQSVGMQGIVFKNPAQLVHDLKEMDVLDTSYPNA